VRECDGARGSESSWATTAGTPRCNLCPVSAGRYHCRCPSIVAPVDRPPRPHSLVARRSPHTVSLPHPVSAALGAEDRSSDTVYWLAHSDGTSLSSSIKHLPAGRQLPATAMRAAMARRSSFAVWMAFLLLAQACLAELHHGRRVAAALQAVQHGRAFPANLCRAPLDGGRIQNELPDPAYNPSAGS
jgi:hypothetical protein